MPDAYEDDPSIKGAWTLWRRIPPWHFTPDGKGGQRASSAAFEDDPDGDPMSVTIVEKGGEIDRAMAGHDGYGLVAISVQEMRDKGQKIVFKPTADEPAHGIVVGEKNKKRFCRKVAKAAKWVVPPPSADEENRK